LLAEGNVGQAIRQPLSIFSADGENGLRHQLTGTEDKSELGDNARAGAKSARPGLSHRSPAQPCHLTGMDTLFFPKKKARR
jgi:hypothetical protein